MLITYTKEQFWEIYKKLPEQIKEYLSSDKTSDIISDIYQKYNVSEEEILNISNLINQVLFGIIPMEDFQVILERDVKIKKDIAKNLYQEIYRYVFLPVKDFLKTEKKEEKIVEKKEILKKTKEEKIKKEELELGTSDSYREIVE